MEFYYTSSELADYTPKAMTVLRSVPNNDGREVLAVSCLGLSEHFDTEVFLITHYDRQQRLSSLIKGKLVPVFLYEYSVEPDGSLDVKKRPLPRVLDKGTVRLKEPS